jgi:hypothetical protein
LTELCQSLASSCSCLNEPPNAIDETRQEAKLLMNLLLSSVSSIDEDEGFGSSNDANLSSDRSSTSSEISIASKRDLFTFTCPSLSLESPSLNAEKLDAMAHEASEPAHLLSRHLKVDDRDALRLSADAMARNVLQSLQKAINWRIEAWIHVLCNRLVKQEQNMLRSGATLEDIKALLKTPEATLLLALQKLLKDRGVSTESAYTSFEVLLQRIDHTSEMQPSSQQESEVAGTSVVYTDEVTTATACSTNTSIQSDPPPQDSYSYTVAHQLRFSCTMQLQTLAGFTEITLAVPGSITGSFESSESIIDPSPTTELKSVIVDLDTNILASMIEKACRTIVRSSVEMILSRPTEEEKEEEQTEANHVLEMAPREEVAQPEAHEKTCPLSSPPVYGLNQDDSVYVTPRCISEDSTHTPAQVLLPMPDDLDRKTDMPRRISPQPMSSSHSYLSSSDDLSLKRYPGTHTLKRRSPPPISIDDESHQEMNLCNRVNSTMASYKRRRLPLISPPGGYHEFHEVPENGPSLPLLVEVACRAMDVAEDES